MPNVLIVQLKRFHMSSTRRSRIKVETLIDFPLNGFDVTEAMSSFNNDNGESYRSTSANNNNNNNKNDSNNYSLQTASMDSIESSASTLIDTATATADGASASSSTSIDTGIDAGTGTGIQISSSKDEDDTTDPGPDRDRDRDSKAAAVDQANNDDPLYDLYGVSNHHGSGHGNGHYTSFCKNPHDKDWYLFNDSTVSRAREEDIASPASYVLFFRKQKITTLG